MLTTILALTGVLVAVASLPTAAAEESPYPPSPLGEAFSIEAERVSIGHGDNWAITWGDDDRQYSFFTDGKGFGTHAEKVSVSAVVIEGDPPKVTGKDVAASIQGFDQHKKRLGRSGPKVSGLVMINGVLYAWVRNINLPGTPKGTGCRLMYSKDRAVTWTWANWHWRSIGYPTWLNAGKNYADAQDGFAYFIAPDGPSAYADYDAMLMARVPIENILTKEAYTFFAGIAAGGKARWGAFEDRKPFFENAEGSFRPDIVYNPGLKKYLLCSAVPAKKWRWFFGTKNRGRTKHLGIFESDTPWGPWRTVFYQRDWRSPEDVFSPHIPSKWISEDGRSFYLLYSCTPVGPYQFNLQKCMMGAETIKAE